MEISNIQLINSDSKEILQELKLHNFNKDDILACGGKVQKVKSPIIIKVEDNPKPLGNLEKGETYIFETDKYRVRGRVLDILNDEIVIKFENEAYEDVINNTNWEIKV